MLACVGAAWLSAFAQAGNPTPQFLAPTVEEGKSAVVWEGGHGAMQWAADVEAAVVFAVEVAGHPSFARPHTVYLGTDRGTYVSGLEEGFHYFRVGVVGEDDHVEHWSQPLAVSVEYPPAGRVKVILAAGSIVLILTVAAIAVGYRRTGRS